MESIEAQLISDAGISKTGPRHRRILWLAEGVASEEAARLVAALAALGWEIEVLEPASPGMVADERRENVRMLRYRVLPGWMLSALSACVSGIQHGAHGRYAFVHSQGLLPAITGSIIAWFFGIPHLISMQRLPEGSRAFLSCMRNVLRSATVVAADSQDTALKLQQFLPGLPVKLIERAEAEPQTAALYEKILHRSL